MVADAELLRQYAETGSQDDFTEIVRRHLNLVYAAALRRLGGDAPLAEEVTQNVFILCARKAAALQYHPALSGWLHQCTRFMAIDALRAKRRRQNLEKAETMKTESCASPPAEIAWVEVRPLIDAALDRLGGRDRDAIMLRFFEGCSFSQIGARLSVSEDAARMRVDRALEKLRMILARRQIASAGVALGAILANQAVVAVPPGLAAAVARSALTLPPVAGLGLSLLHLMGNIKTTALICAVISVAAVGGLIYAGRDFAAAHAIESANRQLENSIAAAVASMPSKRTTPPFAPGQLRNPISAVAVPEDSAAEKKRLAQNQPFFDSIALARQNQARFIFMRLGLSPSQLEEYGKLEANALQATTFVPDIAKGAAKAGLPAEEYVTAIGAELETDLRKLMGDANYSQFHKIYTAEASITEAANYLSWLDSPLSAAQARQIETVLVADPGEAQEALSSPSTLAQLQLLLTPSQLDGWNRYQTVARFRRQAGGVASR